MAPKELMSSYFFFEIVVPASGNVSPNDMNRNPSNRGWRRERGPVPLCSSRHSFVAPSSSSIRRNTAASPPSHRDSTGDVIVKQKQSTTLCGEAVYGIGERGTVGPIQKAISAVGPEPPLQVTGKSSAAVRREDRSPAASTARPRGGEWQQPE